MATAIAAASRLPQRPATIAIQQQAGDGVDRAGDDAQERHVARASPHDACERRRENIQPRRIGKRIAARRDRREVQVAAEHALEAVRVEHRVADRHVGVEQHEQFQEERGGGEGGGETRGIAQRPAAPVLDARAPAPASASAIQMPSATTVSG